MNVVGLQIAVFFFMLATIFKSDSEKVTYLSLERPKIEFFHPKYLRYVNITAVRRGRSNPVHYVSINFDVLVWFGNNISFDFYFYEFLSNRYQRSFVQMQFRFCDLIHKDFFFGPAFKQGALNGTCPYPPGSYHLSNMTISPDVIPRAFPFRKGRIYANVTDNTVDTHVVRGRIDMELKEINRKKGGSL